MYGGLNLTKISREKGIKNGPDGSSLLQKEQKVDQSELILLVCLVALHVFRWIWL